MRAVVTGLICLLASCAPLPQAPQAPGTRRCLSSGGDVTVHVRNRNPADVQVRYGGERRRSWIVPGLSTATHTVPRVRLRGRIGLWIVRGGMNRVDTPPVEGGHVMGCEATLDIGQSLRWSYFFGGRVGR